MLVPHSCLFGSFFCLFVCLFVLCFVGFFFSLSLSLTGVCFTSAALGCVGAARSGGGGAADGGGGLQRAQHQRLAQLSVD